MIVYDDASTEQVRVYDSGADLIEPETFGEYQLSYRSGDIHSPRIDAAEPLQLELQDFARRDPRRPHPPRGRAHGRATSCGWWRPPSARWITTPPRYGCHPSTTRSDASPIVGIASAGCPSGACPGNEGVPLVSASVGLEQTAAERSHTVPTD